ncbi:MAG: hypothetical protein QM674_15865 [Burkholderiaceae bacterium]
MSAKIVTISSARQTLFELFNAVTTRRGRKVIITSRGVAARAVLVDGAYLEELESAAKRLLEIQSSQADTPRFRLIGSGSLAPGAGGDEGDPLAAIRTETGKQADEKIISFGATR